MERGRKRLYFRSIQTYCFVIHMAVINYYNPSTKITGDLECLGGINLYLPIGILNNPIATLKHLTDNYRCTFPPDTCSCKLPYHWTYRGYYEGLRRGLSTNVVLSKDHATGDLHLKQTSPF